MLPDVPISKLPPANLPLTGTEVVVGNQNGMSVTIPTGALPPATTAVVTGDVSGTGPVGALPLTLATVNSNVGGPYSTFTVDAKGRVLTASLLTTTLTLTGAVTGSGTNNGSINTTIAANSLTNSLLSQVAAGTYKGNPTAATANASDHTLPPFANCQLQLQSSTALVLSPLSGNQVTFPNGYIYSLSSSGLTSGSITGGCNLDGVASSTLTGATLYYVYLWYNNGAPAIDFSLTADAVDATTGIKIKTGDNTRVSIGMVYVNSNVTITDNSTLRGVASQYNRRFRSVNTSFSNSRAISNTSPAEVNSEIRAYFLSWGDAFEADAAQSVSNSGLGNSTTSGIGLDGTATVIARVKESQVGGSNYFNNASCGAKYTASKGFHYITISGQVSAGVGTWDSSGTLSVGVLI